jgi:hypothetical protein
MRAGGRSVTPHAQAEYARLSALARLRLEAMQRALDNHEETRRWEEQEFLERVEAGLAELERLVPPT